MTTVLTDNANYTAIANAIRNKAGVATTYTPAQMAAAIAAIPTGGGGSGGLVEISFPLRKSISADSTLPTTVSDLGGRPLPENAPGTDTKNWWGSNGKAQHWWMVELFEAVTAKEVKFASYWSNGGSTWYSSDVILQGSNDGSTWDDLLTLNNLPQSNDQQTHTLTNSDAYCFYRFVCNNTSSESYYTGLGKIQLLWDEGASGGGAGFLSGTEFPTSNLGDDGDVYIRYRVNTTLPEGATELEYIKNTSVTQYMRTGYHGSDDSEYRIVFQYDSIQTQRYPSPFGGRSKSNALENCSYTMYGNNRNYDQDGASWGSNQYIPALGIAGNQILGRRVEVELSAGVYSIEVDGDKNTYTFVPSAVTDTLDMGIFTGIFGNVYSSDYTSVNMRLYRFEISENGTPVHDYIPCIDPNDVACVYDAVTDTYLYNSGSGDFTAGPNAEDGAIIGAYAKVNGAWEPLIGANVNEIIPG